MNDNKGHWRKQVNTNKKKESESPERRSLLGELQRRRVPGFVAAYIVMSWVVIEVSSVILPAFEAPDWILRALIIAAVALSPVAVAIAWFFDLTIHGLVRTLDVVEVEGEGEGEGDTTQLTSQDDGINEEAEPEPEYAQRHLVTVLQCATTITGDEEADAGEQLRELMPALSARYREIVDEYGGYIGPAEGELITVYFGVVSAHEDDSLRAVRAAQEMIESARSFSSDLKPGLVIEATIGLHCGFAIVEPDSQRPVEEWLSNIGQLLKWVSILQLSAKANEVRISRDVFELVRERLNCQHVGALPVPGANRDGDIFAVDSAATEQLLPGFSGDLVGRERERALLEGWWQQAAARQGQVVLLRGEAGIGKTQLVSDIASQVQSDPASQVTVLQCSSYRTHSMLYPVIRFLRQRLGITPQDQGEEAVAALRQYLRECDVTHPDGIALLSELMALGGEHEELKLDPERRKTLLLELLHEIFIAEIEPCATLLLVEDLYWADPTTLELLELLSVEVSRRAVMILMTARPAFRSDWIDSGDINLLSLGRLNREQATRLINLHDEMDLINSEVIDAIIDKADGVPLFLEEFSRSLVDAHDRGLQSESEQLNIPNSLQESLAARIHHLGGASSLLHLGATMGREFSHAWLAAASDLPEGRLSKYLTELVEREILFRRGVGDSVTYAFKHALIRDAAYSSMLPSRRRECHLLVARVLEEHFPVQAERSPELLAQHYSGADHTPENLRKALDYWLKASGVAALRSANIEAEHFLRSALEDLKRLPQGEERDLYEVAIQSRLIPLLGALHGYGSMQMGEASQRALALLDVVEDFENQFMALFSVCVFYMVGGQHRLSFEAAVKIAEICEGQPVAYRVEAHLLLGLNYFFHGELADARDNLKRAIELYDRDEHGDHAYVFGQDPEIVAMAYLGWVYAASGEFDKLPDHSEQLLQRAASLDHPNSSGYALTFTAWARIYVGDTDNITSLMEELEIISERFGLGWSSIVVDVLDAYLRCHRERDSAGLNDFNEALLDWRAIGSQCFLARWDTYYALACLDAGETEMVPAVIDRVGDEIEMSEEYWVQSELPRCQARLALANGSEDQVEPCLQYSMELAARRQAWGLNLVTACDYAEFLLPRDKSRAASILNGALGKVSIGGNSALEQRAQALALKLRE